MVEYQKRRLIPDREEDLTDSKTFAQFGRSGTGISPLRVVASLGCDAFNPFQSKTAHAVVQSTALYMYLLVLPERMRFQKKNMLLLAVLPGEPKQHLINNILNRVVNLLLPLEEGLHYLQTAKYPFGRNVSLVVVPIVCDSLGAHQLVGFPSPTHTLFCTRCLLPKSDISNLDRTSWPRRDPEQHRIRATEWRDAATQKIRNDIYKKYGVRWSELLRLPGFDPIAFTVIDDLHMCLLGLIETHIRDIWGIDEDAEGGLGQTKARKDYQKPPNSLNLSVDLSSRKVIGRDVLEAAWADMMRTIHPSWISPAPVHWGLARTGKLGGNEWKIVGTIHLVVTLIRIWGYGEAGERRRRMLLNFVDLVKATHILLLRVTTPKLREEYDFWILKYLRGVQELFPDVGFTPNHHYSMHMSEFLESMGPGHSRSTPVFEQTNHVLQMIKKNRHAGKFNS
ncbi:hypothetical protein BT96DRAFT_829132 [Gymnopus androsaceus JB14]|uniref:DUF4218 domain-containing protein n=1 Tax=Gymnopus androsaceus JB14 TaxID=1447944 RepID=A0A6A4H8J7_9AGAR|nr:hypothetical protein BT96DRAFT_829132 [Gymnopus androsaceus JB14]